MTDEAKALVAKLRDEDSYYRIQEKHWCIDAEELERQRLAAADLIETQARKIERLREALELADCALRGANMNMNVVERKVRAALGDSHD